MSSRLAVELSVTRGLNRHLQIKASGPAGHVSWQDSSRLAANAPLLSGGLLPFSFADVDKASYIRGMAAFYELGSMYLIEQTFIHGYARSVVRGSDMPSSMKTLGFDVNALSQALADFINTGLRPRDKNTQLLLTRAA